VSFFSAEAAGPSTATASDTRRNLFIGHLGTESYHDSGAVDERSDGLRRQKRGKRQKQAVMEISL
jgi:hypothetical protein